MGILKHFNPVLYPIKLCVMCQPDYYKESELFEYTDGKMIYPDGDVDPACTSPVVLEKETGLFTVVVTFRTPIEYVSQAEFISHIAHEATHAASIMMKHIGERKRGEESFAYLVGWIAKCIAETIEEYKNSDDFKLKTEENE